MQTAASDDVEIALGASDLVCLVAPITDRRAELTRAEAQAIAPSIAKRQHEYATGRWLARRALVRFGYVDPELLAASDGQPLWPAGVIGSLTHDAGHVVVAVGARINYCGIGIDMELGGRVDTELLDRVLTPAERQRYPDLDATLVFSAKEACYKLLFPLFGKFIDFHEVEIDLEDAHAAHGSFSARYIGAATEHQIVHHALARYRRLGPSWLTCVTLSAEKTPPTHARGE